MKVPTKINVLRKRLMNSLTKNIGNSHEQKIPIDIEASDAVKILISRPNHRLGNLLLITPLVQEVVDTFPNCKIDLFVKGGAAKAIFQNYKNINKIITLPRKPFSNLLKYALCWLRLKNYDYDLVINGNKNSSSGRLSTKFANAQSKVYGDVNSNEKTLLDDNQHISEYPIHALREHLSNLGFPAHDKPIPVLDIKLSSYEILSGKSILNSIVNNIKPTICIYTNATGEKSYDENWWLAFYKNLQINYPSHNIIELLPIENISKINFMAPHFYSEDIREMCSLIANTNVFIAADNGVMHLASASQVPVIGFFKVTHLKRYKPYGNGSIAFDTNETNMNDWLKGVQAILN